MDDNTGNPIYLIGGGNHYDDIQNGRAQSRQRGHGRVGGIATTTSTSPPQKKTKNYINQFLHYFYIMLYLLARIRMLLRVLIR
jgi:hypothetical protein